MEQNKIGHPFCDLKHISVFTKEITSIQIEISVQQIKNAKYQFKYNKKET